MPRAIVFDFDGVLVDSEPIHYRAFLKTAQNAGLNVDFDYDHYLRRYVGFDDREGFAAMLEEAGETLAGVDGAQRIEQLCAAKRDVFEALVRDGVAEVPGVRDLIDRLPADLPLAIASGASRFDIDLILDAIGLGARFDPIVSASDVARSKPDPQTYRQTFEGLARRVPELRPHQCLAIEDTASGVASARGAGLTTLAIATTTDAAELHAAHRVIESFNGLTFEQLQAWFG